MLLQLIQREVVRVAGGNVSRLALLLLDVERRVAGGGAVLDLDARGLDAAGNLGDKLREPGRRRHFGVD